MSSDAWDLRYTGCIAGGDSGTGWAKPARIKKEAAPVGDGAEGIYATGDRCNARPVTGDSSCAWES